jgi:UDP-N-acetylmuramate dehydrogenase
VTGRPSLTESLRRKIPGLRGRLTGDAPLKPITWFRVGGPAEALFEPADGDDLGHFLKNLPREVPVLAIGACSNLLVRDGGVRGVVIRLGRGLAGISIEAGLRVRAGAGAPDVKVARAAADAGIAGLAFLRGIPGAVGGALRMNAGAYGREVKDIFVSAEALDRNGRKIVLSIDKMDFSYRHCGVPEGLVFTEALFQGKSGERDAIQAEMDRVTAERGDTQPVNTRTGGSTFKNPPGEKAWELIERAGCRGLTVGGAQVSEKHCNFLINTGAASAADLESLGETVRRRVRERCGVTLEWEIERVGIALEPTESGVRGVNR